MLMNLLKKICLFKLFQLEYVIEVNWSLQGWVDRFQHNVKNSYVTLPWRNTIILHTRKYWCAETRLVVHQNKRRSLNSEKKML